MRGIKAFKVQEENTLQGVKYPNLQKKEVKMEKGLQNSETLQNRAMLSIALCRLLRKGI